MRNFFNTIAAAGIVASAAFSSVSTVSAATIYDQGFETDTFSWSAGTTRVASGTGGVTSSSGSFHGIAPAGAVTQFGGYNFGAGNNNGVPFVGYTTSIDIYLDPAVPTVNDSRFDYSVASSNTSGAHRRDFVITGGFYNSTGAPGTGNRFVFSASNTVPGWPGNPGRDPVVVTDAGWYTVTHEFRDNGSGVLEVEVSLLKPNNTVANTWLLSDPTDVINSTVGGSRYGYFATNALGSFPIDNVSLVTVPEPASLGLLGVAGTALLGRRRRSRKTA